MSVTIDGSLGVSKSNDPDVYEKGSILGTVSQAAGIPTGAVIERGSNGNGEYTKFADGTMICTGSKLFSSDTVAAGAIFGSNVEGLLTWPVTFSDVPTVSINDSASYNIWYAAVSSSSICNFRLFFYVAITGVRTARWSAIGRWF